MEGALFEKKRKYRVNAHCHKVVLNAERTMCLSSGVVKLVFFTLFAILPNYNKTKSSTITTKTIKHPNTEKIDTKTSGFYVSTRKAESKIAEMPKLPLLSTPLKRSEQWTNPVNTTSMSPCPLVNNPVYTGCPQK
jgi:hypothetical protein